MTGAEFIALAFAAALVVAAVISLVAVVRGDGYGHRPIPGSKLDWTDGHLPSRPFRLG